MSYSKEMENYFLSFVEDIITKFSYLYHVSDNAIKGLASDISYRLKALVQDSQKFMCHARRKILHSEDIDHTLKLKNMQPPHNFCPSDSPEFVPFCAQTSFGGQEFCYEDEELDLEEMAVEEHTLPSDVYLKAHWLSIEGVQPAVPENPPLSKEQQKLQFIDPSSKLSMTDGLADKKVPKYGHTEHLETKHQKVWATSKLPVEQQMYFKVITEACIDSNDVLRREALESLRSSPGLQQMLPRLSIFISDGVKMNIQRCNNAFLVYLMCMVKALLENETLCMKKYIQIILPSVVSCVVSSTTDINIEKEDPFGLRRCAARLADFIVRNFTTNTCDIRTQLIQVYSGVLQDENLPLGSYYGAVYGLSILGHRVIEAFIVPRIKFLGQILRPVLEGSTATADNKRNADVIKKYLVGLLSKMLESSPSCLNSVENMETEFGYLHSSIKQQALAASSSSGVAFTATKSHVPPPKRVCNNPTILAVRRTVPAVKASSATPRKRVIATSSTRPVTPLSTVRRSSPTVLKIASSSSSQNLSGRMVATSVPMAMSFAQTPGICVPNISKTAVTAVTSESAANLIPTKCSQIGSQSAVSDVVDESLKK